MREQDALLRNARAVNDKVRLLARLGVALIEAREVKGAAVAGAVGWEVTALRCALANPLRPADSSLTNSRPWPHLPTASPQIPPPRRDS